MTSATQLKSAFKKWAVCLLLLAIFHSQGWAQVGPPPVITVQPLDRTVLKGGTAIFTVSATSGTTLSYQWYEDGFLFFNKKLTGQTASTLTLTAVSSSDEGQYFVQVINAGGTVTSRKATLTVISNTPPVSTNDAYTTQEDVPLIIASPGVLTNDVDANGDALAALLVTSVTHGSLNLNTNGGFTYTPATNYNGTDSFTYRAKDGVSTGNVATVTINITPVNDASPVASNDTYTTLEDVPLNVSAPGILLNDTDVDGDALTAVLVTNVSHGILSLNTNGSFTYTPNTNYNGSDSFTYRVSDGLNPVVAILQQNNSGGNKIEVRKGKDGAQSFQQGTAGGTSYTISKIVLYVSREPALPAANPAFSIGTGVNSGAMAGSSVTIPASSITNTTSGASFQTYEITYPTPVGPFTAGTTYYLNVDNPTDKHLFVEYANANTYTNGTYYDNGSDQNEDMRFQVIGRLSDIATVTLTVTPVNDAPVANNDTYTTLEDVPLTISAGGILTNDTDVEGDALTALLVSNVTKGTLNLNPNGGFTYTPNTNYNGTDSFTYRDSDGFSTGNVATVTINLTPVYDAAIAVNDSTNTLEDVSVTIKVLANDYNPDGLPLTITSAPTTNGTAVISGTNIVFTASTNFNGTVVFNYTVSDGTTSSTGKVTVIVTPVNDAPVAVNDSYTTAEDVQLTVAAPGILANDSDVDGDALTARLVSNVTHGTLNLNTNNGSFTYMPATNYNGSDSFTYRAHDGTTTGNLGTVTINVTPMYDAPVAVNDTTNTLEDTSVTVKVLANDYNPDGSALTLTSTTTNGTAVISGTNVVFTPSTNFNGTAVFTYTIFDGSNSSTASVTVTVTPVNDAPVANNDTYTTLEDVPLTIPAGGILTNDTDVEGDALTALLVSTVTKGNLNLNANGGFTYTPNTNYNGSDSFTYRAKDGQATGNVATVTINITPVNDAPVAVNDSTNTLEDVSVTIKVLANDYDPEGTPLTITGTSTTNGTAFISGTNIVFTPSTNFNGTVVFSYTVSDGTDSSTANVTVTVAAVNDPPVANNDSYTTPEDVQLTIPVAGVLANDTDVEGDALTARLLNNVTNGTLNLNTNGSFTYNPNTNYNGSDSFTYRAESPATLLQQNTNTSGGNTVSVKLGQKGAQSFRNGIAGGPSYMLTKVILQLSRSSTAPNTNLNVNIGTGKNSGAIAGSSVSIVPSSITNSTAGISFQTCEIAFGTPVGPLTAGTTYYLNLDCEASNGKRIYLPLGQNNAYANGTYYQSGGNAGDSTWFQIFETLISSPATVTINVTPVNDPPIGNNDTYSTLEDVPLNVPSPGILTNDTDVDGDALTALLVSNVSNGNLSLNTDGSFTYIPNTNFNGSDSFAYQVSDGFSTGNVATVTINITPVNDTPVANDDAYITSENTLLTVPASGILANDTDVENDPLSASLVTTVSHGSLNLNANGSFTYTPSSNYFGSDSFTYRASDLSATSAVATVSVTVRDTHTPLSFVSAGMTASGFSLSVSAPWGCVCVVEASTNMVDWIPIFTNATLSGSVVFTDPTATNLPSRFYRTVAR